MNLLQRLLLLIPFLFLPLLNAQNFEENVHYFKVTSQQSDLQASKTKIDYFFSYQCPACAVYSPLFADVFKELHGNKNIVVSYHPLVPSAGMQNLARGYFFLITHGKADLTQNLFSVSRSSYFVTESTVKKHIQSWGFNDIDTFWSKSFVSDADVYIADGMKLARKYHIQETPVVVVSGPRGAFKVVLSEELPPDELGNCVKFLLNKQKAPLFLKKP